MKVDAFSSPWKKVIDSGSCRPNFYVMDLNTINISISSIKDLKNLSGLGKRGVKRNPRVMYFLLKNFLSKTNYVPSFSCLQDNVRGKKDCFRETT